MAFVYGDGDAMRNIEASANNLQQMVHKTLDQIQDICQEILQKANPMNSLSENEGSDCKSHVADVVNLTNQCLQLVVSEEKEANSDIVNSKTEFESKYQADVANLNVNEAAKPILNWDSENVNRAGVFYGKDNEMLKNVNNKCTNPEFERLVSDILQLSAQFKPTILGHSAQTDSNLANLQAEINN